MANFVVTIDGNKASRSLKEFDGSKVNDFVEIVDRAYKEKPTSKDLAELRKWLDEFPELWRVVFDMARLIEEKFMKNMIEEKASVIALQKNVEEIRNGFDYEKCSMIEKMLIDNIVISWLAVQYANYQLTVRVGRDEKIVILEFWERRLAIMQRRYLRACETLSRVKRLLSKRPGIQVNIAAPGGQQVNVAGDVVKT
jgi:hypothetical protein